MSEKKLNEAIETTEVAEEAVSDKKTEKKSVKDLISRMKSTRAKKLKNELLFKKGSFSMIITACVLVAVILVNWLVGALSDRFDLKFDMTATKNNTMTKENVEYIKNIKNDVSITVCAGESDYATAMPSFAAQYFQVSDSNSTSYYEQTVNLIKKYADYSKKIDLKFMDTQTTEFAEIAAKYPTDNISFGDILVTSVVTGKDGTKVERHKVITYDKIYNLVDETGYAAMGYGGYTIGGNNIETQLTSAISFVLSAETKKVALLTGHATHNYSESYRELLEANNYEVTIINDKIINEISDEYDVLALVAPNIDFVGSELDVISAFLDNNGKLRKGLIYFADATVPALENLNAFLLEWGIEIGDAILYEADSRLQIENNPFDITIYPGEDEITKNMGGCITGFNVPVLAAEPSGNDISVTELMLSSKTVVQAPRGSSAGWKDYTEKDFGQYAGVIQAEKLDYDSDNNEITSYIMAFSSVEFIYSDWANYSSLSNKNIALAATDRAADVGATGISFYAKTITTESYADTVKASDVAVVRWIFVIILPLAAIITGIVIFIRRKNA